MKRRKDRLHVTVQTVATKPTDRNRSVEDRTSDKVWAPDAPNISREEMREIIMEIIG
jgi:hypothetical protein